MDLELLKQYRAATLFAKADNAPFYGIWLEQRQSGKVDIKSVLDKTTLTPSAVNLQAMFDDWDSILEEDILKSDALAVQLFYPVGLNTLESRRVPKDSREEFDLTRMGESLYAEVDTHFKEIVNHFDFMFIHDESSEILLGQTLLYKQLFFIMPEAFLEYIDAETRGRPSNYNAKSLDMVVGEYLDSYVDYQKITDICRAKSKFWDDWQYRRHTKTITDFREAVLDSIE